MALYSQQLAYLSLLVQRLLDAEVLRNAEGIALKTLADAACRSWEEGDFPAASRHVEQVARFTETLIQTESLAPSDAQAVIRTAYILLDRKTGSGL